MLLICEDLMVTELPSPPECATLAGTPNLVDHILLAEFDVDTGSTVRHKYPCPVPGYTDDFFANFMLPEGAHNRKCNEFAPLCCSFVLGLVILSS